MTNRLHTFAAPGSTQRQQRAARNAELGREVGWSLRLNPTKAYAEEVEGTTPSDLVRNSPGEVSLLAPR